MSAAARHAERVAVVTGAAQGLGRAYARRLAAEGAQVVGVDLQDVEYDDPRIVGLTGDIAEPSDVERLAAFVQERFGRCDILVNNAAFFSAARLFDLTLDELHRVMRVNVDGMVLTCLAFVPSMRDRGWGRVINVSTGMVNGLMDHAIAYVTSKAAIIGFTRALATEAGPWGVTANVVMPGLVRTPPTAESNDRGLLSFEAIAAFQPLGRTLEPDDLAGAVSFLASEDAAMMTGQTIVVDGGVVRL